jgi:hypothetical protein
MVRIGAQKTRDNFYRKKNIEQAKKMMQIEEQEHPVGEPASCWLAGRIVKHMKLFC